MNILVIDDNADHLELLTITLKQAFGDDIFIHTRARLEDGLSAMDSVDPDVVFCDLSFPESSTSSTIAALRSVTDDTPFIILSAHSSEEIASLLLEGGAQDCLSKGELNPPLVRRIVHNAIERQKLLNRVRHNALYDTLTGIPNRLYFMEYLSQAVISSERSGEQFCLVFIDLDGFKGINDSLGHLAGDMVLQHACARLRRRLRRSDFCARLGGDEIACILRGTSSISSAESLVADILEAMTEHCIVLADDRPCCTVFGASAGLAHFPLDASSPGALMRHADQQMYLRKQARRNGAYH